MKKKILILALLGCLAVFSGLVFYLRITINNNNIANKLLYDLIETKKFTTENVEAYKKDFINKCLLARQVYQYSFYKKMNTKMGKLQIEKRYAMDLKEFNDLAEMSWEYNRMLSIPIDSWENYIMLSKWIYESAINNKAEHKTSEIIKMAGYIEDGFKIALYYYQYESCMQKGHKWYIAELFEKRLNTQDIEKIFENWRYVVKFDYAYIFNLLQKYDYNFSWVLTAFHKGERKPNYWYYEKGLKEVPNVRLDGKSNIWEREYYQTVFEIAQGIATGNLERISRWEEKVEKVVKWRSYQDNYIKILQLKFKGEEKYNELKQKYDDLKVNLENYKKINEEITKDMGSLNDIIFENKSTKQKITDKVKDEMRKLRQAIISNYQKMKGAKK